MRQIDRQTTDGWIVGRSTGPHNDGTESKRCREGPTEETQEGPMKERDDYHQGQWGGVRTRAHNGQSWDNLRNNIK